MEGSPMFSKRYNDLARQIAGDFVGKTLARTGISADLLTIISPILTLAAVWLLGTGSFFYAGLLIAFASSFDVLDGALARAKNQVSRFGAFMDSTFDRYSEVFIFFGLLVYYHRFAPGATEILLVYGALSGSLLVSYVRARAEALGYECKVGILERPERIVLIVLGLLTSFVPLVLWIIAIVSHFTAMQRFYHVYTLDRIERASKRSKSPA
jgi:CDP-diacylglycerol--glycerol-3-phosphate 3-phosphatidyltransferase